MDGSHLTSFHEGGRVMRFLRPWPVPIKTFRCPSDNYNDIAPLSNYAASTGPQCVDGPCSAALSPNRIYCNGNTFTPPAGYARSTNYSDTFDATNVRGMFARF